MAKQRRLRSAESKQHEAYGTSYWLWLTGAFGGVVAATIMGYCSSCGARGRSRGKSSANKEALLLRSTWTSLDAYARAELYFTSAAAGLLGEELQSCAKLVQPAEFHYGDQRVRGAAASTDLQPSVFCTIGEGALLSVATVQHMLSRSLSDQHQLLQEIASIEALVNTPADERALLTVLLMREAGRSSSPLMPYIQAFLERAHEHIPAAWDHSSENGSARRAALKQTGGPLLLKATDELRKVVASHYAELVPRALDQLPHLLVDEYCPDQVPCVAAAEYYSLQRFTEVWLSIRSRNFDNGLQGLSMPYSDEHGVHRSLPSTFLVPLACLMNHPAAGEPSNVELRYDAKRGGFLLKAKRQIKRGEELTYSYGSGLCSERALLVYGFAQDGMPSCPGFQR